MVEISLSNIYIKDSSNPIRFLVNQGEILEEKYDICEEKPSLLSGLRLSSCGNRMNYFSINLSRIH